MSPEVPTNVSDLDMTLAAPDAGGVGRHILRGVTLLGLRQVLVQGLGVATGIILARTLDPKEFGLYAISTFFYYLFLTIGDLGLGASLVQDLEEPRPSSYQLAFTVRQIFDLLLLGIVWVAAPALAGIYDLGPQDGWLFRFICLAAFISAFQLTPSVKLERSLSFGRIAIIEVMQAITYASIILLSVLNGWGIMGFGLAWIGFSISGSITANLLCPSRIGWYFDLKEFRTRMRFALPYQATGLLHVVKDSINPILIGVLLGATEVGYINWAQMLATFSVLAMMVLQRVYLPAFSRLQQDRVALGALYQRIIKACNLVNAPIAVMLIVLVYPITILVFGAKWLPAIPLFYFLCSANLALPSIIPTLSLFNALGKSSVSFRFTLLSAVGTWIVALPLVASLGINGFGIAFTTMQLLSFLLVHLVRKEVPFCFLSTVLPAWSAALTMGVIIYCCQQLFPISSFYELIAFGVSGGIIYLLMLALIAKDDCLAIWRLMDLR